MNGEVARTEKCMVTLEMEGSAPINRVSTLQHNASRRVLM